MQYKAKRLFACFLVWDNSKAEKVELMSAPLHKLSQFQKRLINWVKFVFRPERSLYLAIVENSQPFHMMHLEILTYEVNRRKVMKFAYTLQPVIFQYLKINQRMKIYSLVIKERKAKQEFRTAFFKKIGWSQCEVIVRYLSLFLGHVPS